MALGFLDPSMAWFHHPLEEVLTSFPHDSTSRTPTFYSRRERTVPEIFCHLLFFSLNLRRITIPLLQLFWVPLCPLADQRLVNFRILPPFPPFMFCLRRKPVIQCAYPPLWVELRCLCAPLLPLPISFACEMCLFFFFFQEVVLFFLFFPDVFKARFFRLFWQFADPNCGGLSRIFLVSSVKTPPSFLFFVCAVYPIERFFFFLLMACKPFLFDGVYPPANKRPSFPCFFPLCLLAPSFIGPDWLLAAGRNLTIFFSFSPLPVLDGNPTFPRINFNCVSWWLS